MKDESLFERKKQLLEAALKEFANNSYNEASLNTILKGSNISKGSFYYHFKDKEELYLHLLKDAFNKKWQFIAEKSSGKTDSGEERDLFGRFLTQAQLGAEFGMRYPNYHKLSIQLRSERDQPIYEKAIRFLGMDAESILEKMIGEAYDAGEFDPSYSREFVLRTIQYLFNHFDEIYVSDNGNDLNDIVQNLNAFTEMLRSGIARKS